MDSFTLAVVIGIVAMLCAFLGLALVDKGMTDEAPTPKSRSKKSP